MKTLILPALRYQVSIGSLRATRRNDAKKLVMRPASSTESPLGSLVLLGLTDGQSRVASCIMLKMDFIHAQRQQLGDKLSDHET